MTLGPGGGAVVDFNFFGDARDLDAMVACARAGAAINRELARRGLDLEAVSDLGDAALAARVRAGAQSAHGAFGKYHVLLMIFGLILRIGRECAPRAAAEHTLSHAQVAPRPPPCTATHTPPVPTLCLPSARPATTT